MAAERPVAGLIFVCGVIPPRKGERDDDGPPMEAPGAFDRLAIEERDRIWLPDPDDAIAAFYHDCDRETATWAARERLLGAPVFELPGSHSPFLSRPDVFADVLVDALGRL